MNILLAKRTSMKASIQPYKPATLRLMAAIAAALPLSLPATGAENYPKVLQPAISSGLKVVKQFPAASGLTGWVLSQGGQYSLVYTTADKKTLVAGTVIGENGENFSAKYEEKYIPKPDFSSAFLQLDKASYVVEGAKTPKSTIYVFVDPNCPYCHFLWQALQPYEAAGLQVNWIPVATLGPTSMPKAIEVLAAKDRATAFRQMEQNHGKPWSPSKHTSENAQPVIAAAVRKNGLLMAEFGLAGTPGVVWRDKQGKVQVTSGMPRLSELPAITGLPEQAINDPSLAKFR